MPEMSDCLHKTICLWCLLTRSILKSRLTNTMIFPSNCLDCLALSWDSFHCERKHWTLMVQQTNSKHLRFGFKSMIIVCRTGKGHVSHNLQSRTPLYFQKHLKNSLSSLCCGHMCMCSNQNADPKTIFSSPIMIICKRHVQISHSL